MKFYSFMASLDLYVRQFQASSGKSGPSRETQRLLVFVLGITTRTARQCSRLWVFSVRWWLAVRRRQWHPTPVLLPGKSHGWRSRIGCSPWGREESDMTERLPFRFSLSCIGEGNGNPLQYSCLENPRDRGAWWATVYGVAQSQTRLKQLSSSSSICISEVIVISPGNLDSSFCFIQPSVSHDVLCI